MMMMMMTSCIMLFLFLHDPMLNMFMCLWVSIKIVQRCLPVVCYVLNRKLTEKRRRRQKLPTFVIIYYFTKDWYILSPPLSTQFPTSFHWTCYCTFYFLFSIHLCDSVWSLWVEVNLCSCLFIYVLTLEIQFLRETGRWDPIHLFNHAICLRRLSHENIEDTLCWIYF
jgi:hypothetical protein